MVPETESERGAVKRELVLTRRVARPATVAPPSARAVDVGDHGSGVETDGSVVSVPRGGSRLPGSKPRHPFPLPPSPTWCRSVHERPGEGAFDASHQIASVSSDRRAQGVRPRQAKSQGRARGSILYHRRGRGERPGNLRAGPISVSGGERPGESSPCSTGSPRWTRGAGLRTTRR